jgi:hypothetical protein
VVLKTVPDEERTMNPWTVVALVALFPIAAFAAADPADQASGTPSTSPWATDTACPVTQPNGVVPPKFGRTEPPQPGDPEFDGGYGNATLWTNLWMWGEGEVAVPLSHMRPDGSFGEMKWAWYRYMPGRLTIEGRRLDAPAPPLHTWIPDGYGEIGFQVAGIVFPNEGCWEITGRVGEASLTFVTLVVPPASAASPVATP